MTRLYLLIIVLMFLPSFMFATHIVGGEVTYVHNGGPSYTVTMKIYRDDFNGNPNAQFDDPAVLVVYDENGNYVDEYYIDLTSVINDVQPPFSNPCLDEPNNVIIQEGTYIQKINLPNANIGYHLVYARCCRNDGLINNLFNAGDQGGLYTAFIPRRDITPNSNPVFDNFPPIFICEDAPLFFDHSATDIDGDSMFYEICTPFQGLTPNDPVILPGNPIPFGFGPPFDPVVYQAPYSATDPLGGIPLSIDGNTGILTGTPSDQGTYVVGVCVSEYRNGVLLSTTLRDFQYTVTECNSPIPIVPIIEPWSGSFPGADPNITISGIYERNCNDSTITFINNSSPPSGVPFSDLIFEWDFGDGSPTSSQFQPTHTYADTGTFLVQLDVSVDNPSFPCIAPYYVVVQIYPEFEPEFLVDDACQADGAVFFDQTTAPFDEVIGWNWNFGDGGGSTLQNPSHIYNNPGTYVVNLRATTEKGCVDNIQHPVTIHPQPVADFDFQSPICEEEIITFTNNSTISSGTISDYEWDLSVSSSTNVNPAAQYNSAGTYDISLLAISNFGCSDSVTQQLVVNPLPNIGITPDTIICPNTNLQLFASGGVDYVWFDSTNLNNPNIANPIASFGTTPETFTVVVTTADGCSDSEDVVVDLLPLPPAEAGEDTSVCLNNDDLTVFNTTVPLMASGGVQYSWSPSAGLSSTNTANTNASPSVNTTYTVVVTDTNGCIALDTVRVTVLNPALDLIGVTVDSLCIGDTVYVDVEDQGQVSTYTWSPASFVTDPSANEPGFYPPNTTSYELALSNYCYEDRDTVLIEVLQRPNLDAGPLDSICEGDPPYQLSATPDDLEYYLWTSTDPTISDPSIFNPTVQPAISSTYYLTGIDSIGTFGCASEDSVGIIVYDNPSLSIQLPLDYPGFVCLGSAVEIEAVTNNGIEFDWTSNPPATFDNTNTQVVNAIPVDTTQFNVVTTNTHGCFTEDSIVVDVQLPVNPSISGDSTMCYGSFVNLQASGGLYYQWLPDSIFSTPNFATTQAFPDSTILVEVVVSNDCFDSIASMPITVYPLPSVDAGEDIEVIRDDATGFLNGSGSGTPLWYAADESFHGIVSTPYVFDPEVSPFVTTDYVLQIEDPLTGCYNYDTATVFVEVITLMAFPTGFSPDGNGTNDVARIIKTLNIKNLKSLTIYNRWGEMVYNTEDLNEGWDGTYKTLPQEIGVYPYVIEAVTKDDENYIQKGNITLIR